MTTGGGWQDQVHLFLPNDDDRRRGGDDYCYVNCALVLQIGALYGGFKIGRSARGLPLRLTTDLIPTSDALNKRLQQRMCLFYTGKQVTLEHHDDDSHAHIVLSCTWS